ncbi:MAG: hypothetical protein MI784_17240, partial [Cytophagales bacterium]|nr:hypothetical protein [Cytophagales bacterium]
RRSHPSERSGDEAHPVCSQDTTNENDDNTATGFIDTAAFRNTTADNCSRNVERLNTSDPADWTVAYQTFCSEHFQCSDSGSCHLPHDQLLTFAGAGDNTVLQLSRQRYPFNSDADKAGLVRVTRFHVDKDGSQIIDKTFGENGFLALYPNQMDTLLPENVMPIAQVMTQSEVVTLYPSATDGDMLLARFPLNGEKNYDITNISRTAGRPFFISFDKVNHQYGIWTHQHIADSHGEFQDIVRHYQPWFNQSEPEMVAEYNLTGSGFVDAPIIGLGLNNQNLYVARKNNTDLVVERLDLLTHQLDDRHATMENALESVTLDESKINYTLYAKDNHLVMVPRDATFAFDQSNRFRVLKAEWPEYTGGCTIWRSEKLRSTRNP